MHPQLCLRKQQPTYNDQHLPCAFAPVAGVQGPLSRFGDTAANTGMLALLEDVDIPVPVKTVAASVAAGLFRIFLMPVDACKTIMQASRTGSSSSSLRHASHHPDPSRAKPCRSSHSCTCMPRGVTSVSIHSRS